MAKRFSPAGLRRHQVTLQNPSPAVPDGDGSFTETPPLTVAVVRASIESIGAKQIERITSGTVIAQAANLIVAPYVAGITTKSLVTWGSRTYHVAHVGIPEEGNRELQLLCIEDGV